MVVLRVVERIRLGGRNTPGGVAFLVDSVAVVVEINVVTLALGAGARFANGGYAEVCAVIVIVLVGVLLLWWLGVWLLCWLFCCVVRVGFFPSVVKANHDSDFDVFV